MFTALVPILLAFLTSSSLSQTIQNNYTDVYGQSVAYQGCFVDNGPGNRVLPIPPGPSAPAAMTVAACGLACGGGPSGLQLNYFGIEYGGECYCGNASTSIASLTTSSNCNMACVGNNTQVCGGQNAINVYSQALLSQQPSFTNPWPTAQPLGCWRWNEASGPAYFLLTHMSSSTASLEQCSALCYNAGYPVSTVGYLAWTCGCMTMAMYTNGAVSRSFCTISQLVCPGGSQPEYCGTSYYYYAHTTGAANASLAPASITANVNYTAPLGSQWQYVGCYNDSASSRVLSQSYAISAAILTPQRCMDVCEQNGYSLSGTTYGTQCWCGQSLLSSALYPNSPYATDPWVNLTIPAGYTGNQLSYQRTASLQGGCIMQCPGSSNMTCGGVNAIQIFSSTSTQSVLSTFQSYKNETVSLYGTTGCYADNSTAPAYRIFPVQVTSIGPSAMTQSLCIAACSSLSFGPFRFAGLQYGKECWCSNNPPTSTALPLTTCNMPCSGNSSQICGAGNTMLVFSMVAPANISAAKSFQNFNFLGHYTEGSGTALNANTATGPASGVGRVSIQSPAKLLPSWVTTGTFVNLEWCASQCTNLSLPFFGLGSTYGCYCGLTFTNQYGLSNNTFKPCAAAAKEACGSDSGTLIYNNTNTITTPRIMNSLFSSGLTSGSSYYGCFIDSVANRALPYRAYPTSALTPQTCLDSCFLLGYSMAGLEFGSECWCGTSTQIAAATATNHADCVANGLICPGNTNLACGSGNRLAVYQAGTSATISIQTSINSYTSQGCFSDSINSRTLRYKMSLDPSAMTPAACTAACAASGYYYAGLEFASECWCDNSIQNGLTALASIVTCQMPCTGTASYYCGGGNAIIVYYNSALTRTTLQTYTTTQAGSSGIVWRYKACWGEPAGGRGLPNPLNNNAIGTVQSCLEMGSAAGYNACGLEYGGECWCNSIAGNPYGGQVPENMCQTNGMVCRGNSLNYCGAGNIFSFYSTGVQSYTLF